MRPPKGCNLQLIPYNQRQWLGAHEREQAGSLPGAPTPSRGVPIVVRPLGARSIVSQRERQAKISTLIWKTQRMNCVWEGEGLEKLGGIWVPVGV